MKKIILFGATVLLAVASLYGQTPCTPDESYTSPGIYPDTTEGIDSAYVYIPYEEVIQFVAPEDTTADVGGGPQQIPINWIRIDSITGLPGNFDYVCHNSDCKIPGGENGCLSLYGTAGLALAGNSYPLTVYTTNEVDLGFLGNQEVPSEITGYYLNVSNIVGIQETFPVYSHQLIDGRLNIYFKQFETVNVRVYSLLGENVLKSGMIGAGQFDLSSLSDGIYIVELTYQGKRSTFKIVK